jgi:hypothetical protein
METVSMTVLLRDPKRVIRQVERVSEVLIKRRDAAPLRLALSSRAEAEREGTRLLARLLAKALPEVAGSLWPSLVDALPWLRFLPYTERPTFLREFLETVEACSSVGNNAALAQLLHEWKATAEVYSDPALADRLAGPSKGTRIKVRPPKH